MTRFQGKGGRELSEEEEEEEEAAEWEGGRWESQGGERERDRRR